MLGWFNMGSTVVSVFPKVPISLEENIKKIRKYTWAIVLEVLMKKYHQMQSKSSVEKSLYSKGVQQE